MDTRKLKYVDRRPIFIPKLKNYPKGLTPALNEEITVSANEAIKLLKMKNGNKNCWKEVKKESTRNQARLEPEKKEEEVI